MIISFDYLKSLRMKSSIPIVCVSVITSLFLILVSCTSESKQDKGNNALSDLGLTGQVKKLTEISFDGLEMKFGEVQKGDLIQSFSYSLDKKGHKIEETMTNPYSTELLITKYKYDNQINLVEKYTIEPGNPVPLNKSVWEYDAKNNLKFLMYYNPGNTLSWKETYTYDNKGSLIEISGYEGDGTFSNKRICKYDKGKKIENCDYDPNGKIKGKTTYKYDEKNRLTEESRFNLNGDLFYKFTTQYGEYGHISETSLSYLNMPYEYLNNLTIKKFDKQGKITEELKYEQNGQIIYKEIFEYPVYDTKDNWLTKVRIMEIRGERTLGSTYGVTERQIEYY